LRAQEAGRSSARRETRSSRVHELDIRETAADEPTSTCRLATQGRARSEAGIFSTFTRSKKQHPINVQVEYYTGEASFALSARGAPERDPAI